MATITTRRAAQSIRLVGDGYVVRTSLPASIVRAIKRPPLTQEESDVYQQTGGEAGFRNSNNRFARIVNVDLAESLGAA